MWPVVPDAPQSRALYWEQAQKQARLVVLAAPLAAVLVPAVVVVVVVGVAVLVSAVGVAAVVAVVVAVVVVVAVQQQHAQQHHLFGPELAVSDIILGWYFALAVGHVGYNYYP